MAEEGNGAKKPLRFSLKIKVDLLIIMLIVAMISAILAKDTLRCQTFETRRRRRAYKNVYTARLYMLEHPFLLTL